MAISKDLIGFVVEQYHRYGPIFRIRALNKDMVVMAGPEANAFVTQEGADKLSSREVWGPYGQEFEVGDYIQDIDGEQHNRFRKILKRGYSPSMMLSNPAMLVNIAQNVINKYPVGEEVPALYLLRLIVTEQLGTLLANHAAGADLQALITATAMSLNVYVVEKAPAITLRAPGYQRARRRFLELGREILKEHRTGTRAQPDLVDDILAASQEPANQDILGSESQLVFSALGPFIAGLDTVANECTFMLYALLEHPDVMEQCVAEADEIFAEGLPDPAKLRSIHFIHDAMMETLRRYAIAPALTRTAAKDFEFAGYRVEKGQRIIIATTAAHFMPEVFPDPYKFDITRYSEPRNEHKKKGAYAPFGVGAHTCLGAGAAEIQIALVMASVLHMVRFERADSRGELPIRNNPTPTFGYDFQVRIAERRHVIPIDSVLEEAPV
jgi:cytochrome P450